MDREQQADSVQIRQKRERAKAIRKYGEVGQLPGGNPDYDIIDYFINELIGIRRYVEMIEHRYLDVSNSTISEDLKYLVTIAELNATSLIELRLMRIRDGEDLGSPEP